MSTRLTPLRHLRAGKHEEALPVGVAFLDSADEMIPAALNYLGLNPQQP